jgi:hypothetical protein
VFWFALVPAFRFGESAIWTTAGCLGAVALQQVLATMSHRGRQVALLGLLALGGWCSYPRTLWKGILERAFHSLAVCKAGDDRAGDVAPNFQSRKNRQIS